MAIAFDAANSVQGTFVSSLTTSAWTIAGSDRLLVAGMGWSTFTPPTYTSIKWDGSGGTALTQIGTTVSSGSYDRLALSRLIAPATGSKTLYGELSGATDEFCLGGVSLTGVDQTTPLGTEATNTGSGTASSFTSTVNVSSATDELVVDMSYGIQHAGGTITIAVGASQTMRWEQETINDYAAGTQSTEAGATTVTMSHVYTPADNLDYSWAAIGVGAKPAAAGATLDQYEYRPELDDGTQSGSTQQSEGVGWDGPDIEDSFRIRFGIEASGDPAARTFILEAQYNGAGGYFDAPVGASTTTSPTPEAADCTESGNNTATTSWAVSYPAYVNGDLLLFHVASDADVTHDWPATGPNGETITTIKDSIGGTAQRASGFWFIGSATTIAGTLTVTPSATEQWTAVVLKIPTGEFDATTPIQTNLGEANDTTADTSWATPAWTADAVANGKIIVFASQDTVTTNAAPGGWTTLIARDRGAIGCTLGVRNALNTASESITSANFTNVSSETDSSFGYVVNPKTTNNKLYVFNSTQSITNGDATTKRLTASGAGSFVAGKYFDTENGTGTVDITNNNFTEIVYNLKTSSAVIDNDYWDFRLKTLNTYAGGEARVTINTGGAGLAIPIAAYHHFHHNLS